MITSKVFSKATLLFIWLIIFNQQNNRFSILWTILWTSNQRTQQIQKNININNSFLKKNINNDIREYAKFIYIEKVITQLTLINLN